MSRHLVWLCVELTKDDPRERGKNRDVIDEALEEEVDLLQVDVDGAVYTVNTIGRGRTKEACRESITSRMMAQQSVKNMVAELP